VPSLLIRNATILTMNDAFEVIEGAVSVRDGRIISVGPEPAGAQDTTIDAGGGWLLPGFIQTHIHLCQTLFRGYADDLRLMDWLRRRVWPMEAAHTPASLGAAARLACYELIRSGTTSILTMETVHDTAAVFEAVTATGIRATIGKCMMDAPTPGAPDRLREGTRASLDESAALQHQYHGTANGRIRAAFAPRFAVSCTRDLLEAVAGLSAADGSLVHSHAAEQQEEIALVRDITGMSNVDYFAAVELASPRLNLAHCVWVDPREREVLAAHDVKVTHCPGSNLKLGSGIAPVPDLLDRGICVSLGSDGAACNNHLDMFGEMRLAATLQAVQHGPGTLTARTALWMATRSGARALGLDAEIGVIEPGKCADLVIIDRWAPHFGASPDPYSAIVYAGRPGDVCMTVIDGEILVRDGLALQLDGTAFAAEARSVAARLAGRAGL
jgi:cytosine/adenosine deaminase-related metal-dependent hydrolase